MGGLVEEQLRSAVASMVEGDVDTAARVVRQDHLVNGMEVDIDEECTRIIANHELGSAELRLVIAVIKTITDLERIGDEAERVAKMAKFMGGDRFNDALMNEVEHMGELVSRMLHLALDAFARTDLDEAVEVVRRDDKVDGKYESITRQLVTFMVQDPRCIQSALHVLWAARSLERIGDRSQNIAEYIVYLVKGKDVRHTTLENLEAQVDG
jgi:phosphate transport system protein